MFIKLLFLPVYSPEAGGEFGSVCFVVCDAGTTETVTRTVFRTSAIYVIMWTGHGSYSFLAQNLRKGTKKIPHMQTYAGFSFIFLTFLTLSVFLHMVETQREDLKDDFVQNFHPVFFFAFSFHIRS